MWVLWYSFGIVEWMKGRGIEWIFQFFFSIHSFDEGEGQPWACNKLKQLPWKVVSASNLSYNILNSDLSLILWYMALNLDSNLRKIALIWRRLLTSSTFINCWNIIFISFQSTSKREQTSSATVAPSEEPPEELNRCWLLESKPLAGMAFFPKTNTCWEQPE